MTETTNRIPLIGEPAPPFNAETTQGPSTSLKTSKGNGLFSSATRPTSRPCAPLSS